MKLSRRSFLGLGLALAISGCASGTAAPSYSGPAVSSGSEPLTLMMPGPSGSSACARISQRLSALTRPQLGFEIQLEQQPFARYESALWQRLMQKQAPDLFFLSAALALLFLWGLMFTPVGEDVELDVKTILLSMLPYVIMFVIMLAGGIFLFVKRHSFYVSYDYTFVSGELRISKVF